MPGRNGRGPRGQGPMTGRGMGGCGGAAVQEERPQRGPGFGPGQGAGQGGGGGRGWGGGRWGGGRWGWRRCLRTLGLASWPRARQGASGDDAGVTPPSREQELAELKQQAISLEQTLAELQTRIRLLDEPTTDAAGREAR